MFGKRITLFRLLGFEVRLDWSWIIIAILVTWSLARGLFPSFVLGLSPGTYWWMGVAGAAGLFISIILHELGHSLVARRFEIPMTGITLFVFGGVAEMGREPPSAKSEFLMAVAGPLTSVLLAGISFGIRRLSDVLNWPVEVTAIFAYLSWINLLLAVFNLLPAFPLDGGRVLRSILWAVKRNLLWATRIAATIGTVFGYLLIAWGILSLFFGNFFTGIWWFLIGFFIRNASRASYEQVVLQNVLAGAPVARFMNPHPVTVPPSTSVKDLIENYVYRYNYKMFPVVEDGRLLGCIYLNQLRQIPRQEWEHRTAQTVALPCSGENTITPETDAVQALSTMSRNQASRLMVVDHDRLVGIIALKDLMDFLSRKLQFEGA